MKQIKRSLGFLLALCLVLSMIPVTASAATSGKCGRNLTWNLSSNGTLTISGTGEMYEWYSADGDVPGWVQQGHKADITKVVIEDGVTSIDITGFGDAGLPNLKNMYISATVASIDAELYDTWDSWASICYGCSKLEGIWVDENNQYFSSDKNGAFYDKDKTVLYQVPTTISGTYTVPSSVKVIGPTAFYGCSALTQLVIPASVTSISHSITSGCDSLKSVIFQGNAPSFHHCYNPWEGDLESSTFNGEQIIAYYPANNSTWTQSVMQNCEAYFDYDNWEPASHNMITWVPYTPGETPGGGGNSGGTTEPEVESHDTLAELTEVDYMMFSILAYRDLSGALGDPDKNTNPKTIKEFYSSKWSKKIPTSDGDLGALNVTYAQAFGGIANWYPTAIRTGVFNGFSATIFCNDSGECVIAYCGSIPLGLSNILSTLVPGSNAFFDWIVNDFQMQIADVLGPQADPALSVYKSINNSIPSSKIAVTGHSLGGGLANIVSAYSGCEAVTFNAISSLDTAYNELPGQMGKEFESVNKWNITDHTNEYDILAGMYEASTTDFIIPGYEALKPYKAHKSLNGKGSVFANHGMKSFLTKDSSGSLTLTKTVDEYSRSTAHSQTCGTSVIELGTDVMDVFMTGIYLGVPLRSYGGNGGDTIWGSIRNDYLIGGNGNDKLNGDRGDDQYLYYKGDGVDTIYDIGGDDKLYLYGFSSNDTITLYEASGSDRIEIRCNGETIVNILTQNREYSLATLNSFKVYVEKGSKTETINITEYFKTSKYGSRILVACPVDVEVLDANGTVVYTLYDGEVGSYYTDYGTFHVYEEENGEYGKVLDLVEGYTIRIVGVDEGTMDVTYQIPVDGELSVPVSLTDVPVSEDMTAVIEAVDESEVYLVTDDDTIQMEHIHSWDNGVATTQATCTEAGERTFTCTTCGETRTEVIEAWGHNYVAEVTEPTCTEQGYTTVICYGCNDSTVSDYTEALGHNYEDGYCSVCGDLTVSAPVAKGSNKASTGKPVVTWEPVEGAVKYEVYRSTKKNGTYTRGTSTTGTTYTNTKAVAGKYYYYFVRAIDADGNYADSNIIGRTCDLAQTTITVSNVASTGKVKISWTAVEGATKYEVYRATSKNGTYSRISTTANTSVTNTKAEAGKTYYYKVRAICDVDAAAGAYSAVKSRTCDLAQTTVTLSNVASTGKIKISWKAVEGATKYEVYRATSKDGTYSRISTTSNTSVTNTKADAGKTYYYKVRAICDVDAAAAAYSEVKSRACDLAQPSVSIALSSKKPKVSWDKVTGAVSYKVYRATSKTGTYSLVKTTTSLSYRDTKATAGKTYYYKVVAVCSNTSGNSAYSSIVSIKSK